MTAAPQSSSSGNTDAVKLAEQIHDACPHYLGFDYEIGPIGCRLVSQELECVCEHVHMHALRAAFPTPQIAWGEPIAWSTRVRDGGMTYNTYTERLPFEPDLDSRIVVLGEPVPLYVADWDKGEHEGGGIDSQRAFANWQPIKAILTTSKNRIPSYDSTDYDKGGKVELLAKEIAGLGGAAQASLPPVIDRGELIALLQDLASVNLSRDAVERQARRMADDLIARGLSIPSTNSGDAA